MRPQPFVGQPATINLFTDSRAAVVVKVNKRSVVVASVATTEATRDQRVDQGPFPVMRADGILTEIVGTPERFARIDTDNGPRFANGSISVTLGHSTSVTDYRF